MELTPKAAKIRRSFRPKNQETPNWILAEDAVASFFRSQGFRVQQQVKVGSGAVIDMVALWRRPHEKHHFLIECKDRSQFSRSNEKELVKQLQRYFIGYTKTRLAREALSRWHIIILLGICTKTYYLAHRQIPFRWNPKKIGGKLGRRIHAVRCYITTPPNLKKVLEDANIPKGYQKKLSC